MSWKVLAVGRNRSEKETSGNLRSRIFFYLFLLVTAVVLFSGYAWAEKSLVLAVEGEEFSVQTFSRTVGEVLERQNIVLLEKDEVLPATDTPVKDGMVIKVLRALKVTVEADGQEIPARTRGRTVADVLAEYGIKLGAEDEVTPGPEELLSPGMKIKVTRVRTETIVDEAAIKYQTRNQYTTKLPQGSTRVAREGRNGAERQTFQVTYRDGREVNRRLIAREVITPPVDRVVMIGSGMVISRGGNNIRYSDVKDMLASAYTYTGNNTASGVPPRYGVVAVDPREISMGTSMYVEGYGYATALDRGGAIKGNRIDLFFETYEEAMNWGMRRVKVYILE